MSAAAALFPPPGLGMPLLLEDEDKLEMERGSCEDDIAAADWKTIAQAVGFQLMICNRSLIIWDNFRQQY